MSGTRDEDALQGAGSLERMGPLTGSLALRILRAVVGFGIGMLAGGVLVALLFVVGGLVAWAGGWLLTGEEPWELKYVLIFLAVIGAATGGGAIGAYRGAEAGWRGEPMLRTTLRRTWAELAGIVPWLKRLLGWGR